MQWNWKYIWRLLENTGFYTEKNVLSNVQFTISIFIFVTSWPNRSVISKTSIILLNTHTHIYKIVYWFTFNNHLLNTDYEQKTVGPYVHVWDI